MARKEAGPREVTIAALLVVAAAALMLAPSAGASVRLAVTQYGYLTGTPTISRVNPSTGSVHTVASGSPLTSASYLTFEDNGNLAVTDENLPGIFTVKPGSGSIHKLGGGSLDGPYGIDTDPHGNLIVAVYGDGIHPKTARVVRVNPKTGDVHKIIAGGWLADPQGVAVNPHTGAIYVVDYGGAVDRLTPSGHRSTIASGAPFSAPWGITRAPDGTLYVNDDGDNTLYRVNPKTGGVHSVAALGSQAYGVVAASNRTAYATDFGTGTVSRVNLKTGDVTPAASGLNRPIGITVEP